ncbi:MAG: DNA-binding protein [Nitrospirae bacterium]|nr:DNA-binding protein [Nitrospirota bacterium]
MKKAPTLFILMSILTLVTAGAYAASQKSPELTREDQDMITQDTYSLSGKVVEAMDSGGYTYVMIEKGGKKTWVAVPQIKVTVGQDVSFQPGMVMSNFTSKTLNRTFESIVFSSGAAGKDAAASVSKSDGPRKTEAPANKTIKVEKASGPNAFTVAELYEKRGELDKKDIVVRGQVVKFSASIMDKNWLHIQDGSGDPLKGTNDILVTSQDKASVGDVITAKGVLYKDKDFGSGYKYSVIVEQASINK